MKDLILLIIIGILILALGFLVGNIYPLNEIKIQENKLFDNNTNCSGMNLLFTTECLNKELSSFYFYNISQVGKELKESELRESGGVCSSASEYYKEKAETLGYYGTTCDFDVYKDSNGTLHRHEIAIISGEDKNDSKISYCILDQKSIVGCNELMKLEDLNKSEVSNETN